MADVVIIVRRQAEASGNYVRICDVARVDGPKEQVAEVASVILGPTPQKGETREISRRDIELRLFEMGIGAAVSFDGNETVRVFGNGIRPASRPEGEVLPAVRLAPLQGFPGDDSGVAPASRIKKPDETPLENMSAEARERLSLLISDYLSGQYPRTDIEVSAKLLALSENIPFSAREITVEKADGRLPGKATLRLRVRETPESEPRQVTVSADTRVFGLAPVAARNLARGEILGRKDVRIARIPM
ncbi:MAG: hypothetical protein LBE84_12430, partial [Planctomycetota bacterium]|nr:hypothetical protein [Planctomycetota bacterium]